jgi:hypothetical protein
MWEDPIVKETRELRKKYASKFENDPDAIFEDILRRQEISKKKRISFPARRPKSENNIAYGYHTTKQSSNPISYKK